MTLVMQGKPQLNPVPVDAALLDGVHAAAREFHADAAVAAQITAAGEHQVAQARQAREGRRLCTHRDR